MGEWGIRSAVPVLNRDLYPKWQIHSGPPVPNRSYILPTRPIAQTATA